MESEAVLLKAKTLLDAGKYQETIKQCTDEIDGKGKKSKEILFIRSRAFKYINKLEEALEDVKACLVLDPGDSSFLEEQAHLTKQMAEHGAHPKSEEKIDDSEKTLYANYRKWMESLGSEFNKIELKYFYADYRGVVASEEIHKGDTLVYVPKGGMITLKMAREAKIGKILVDKKVSLIYPNNSVLSTFVITEMKNPHTKWKFFLESLPKSVSNFPIFFEEEEKNLLVGSPFAPQIQELRDDMEKDYTRICTAVPEFKKMATLHDFMRTRALVNSRIFGTKIDGEENDSIVPLADMFNYKYHSDMTHWTYSPERQGFVVKSKENIHVGEEIFVYYGNKPNSNFFQFYGFVIEKNDHDEVNIPIAVLPKDPLREYKEEVMKKEKVPSYIKVSGSTEDKNFPNLMSCLRFLTFQGTLEAMNKIVVVVENEKEKTDGTSEIARKAILPFSIENEKMTLALLKEQCVKNLEQYKTTFEEDMKRLDNEKLTYNQRNCLLFVSNEKRVLKFFISLVERALILLNAKSLPELDAAISSENKMASYFKSLRKLLSEK